MASVQATGRRHKGTREDGWYPLALEEVAEALQRTRDRTLRRDCLESRDRAYRWCVRRCFAEGRHFRSTLMQAAKGMGYPLADDDDEQNFNSFAKSVRRCMDDLQAAGLIESWGGVKRSNGQWRCIEVRMPCEARSARPTHDNLGKGKLCPPLAPRLRSGTRSGTPEAPSTVSRARLPRRRRLTPEDRRVPHRPSSTARRIFFSPGKMPSPEGVFPPSGDKTPRRPVARARDRAQPGLEPGCARPTNSQVTSAAPPPPGSSEGSGPAGLPPGELQRRGRPGRPATTSAQDGIPAARAAYLAHFEALFGCAAAARFSHRRWGSRLDRALARLDRYAAFGDGRPGAGLDYAAGLMEAEAEGGQPDSAFWDPKWKPPASPAYFVPLLEEVSKTWRRKQARRAREAPAGWRGTWASPKKRKGRRAGSKARAPDET